MTFLLLKVEWVTLSTVQRGLLEWTFAIRPAPGFVSVIADGVKSQSITRYWTKESLSNLLVACATLKNASVFLFFSFLDFPVQVHYGFSNWCPGEPYSRHMTRSFLPVGDFTINRIKASQTIWGLLGWFFEGGGGGASCGTRMLTYHWCHWHFTWRRRKLWMLLYAQRSRSLHGCVELTILNYGVV